MSKFSPSTKSKLKIILIISAAGIFLGGVYSYNYYGSQYRYLLMGGIIGFLMASISSSAEVFLFSKKFSQYSFPKILIIRSLFYIALISLSTLSVLFVYDSIQYNTEILSAIRSQTLLNFIRVDFLPILFFSISASLLINFILQMSQLIGWKEIMNVMLGKYKTPQSDKRVFMFLDLKSSTKLGERLSTDKYSNFLRDFFSELTDPVIATNGEIYQYVGDEVVLSWDLLKDSTNERCLDCYFMIVDKINLRSDYYHKNYGIVPRFKAGIHSGDTIVTEVGDLQREVVYHGDVLNTTSRIQHECNKLHQKILVSGDYISTAKLNGKYNIKRVGEFRLRGKRQPTELFTVVKNNIEE